VSSERAPVGGLTRDELIDEVTRLREALARAERTRRDVARERDRLQRQRDRLKDQLDAARRAGFRQAAPFAKARRQGTGRPPGRRAGRTYGRRAHRPRPPHIDAQYEAPVPPACPDCGGAVTATHTATQVQEELPVVRPVVRAFRVHIGACDACGRRVQGRHPLQTSDALGAAGTQLGPQATTFAVWCHKGLGLPLGKVQRILRTQYGLHVTRGGLAQLCARVARRATPTYEALRAEVRRSPVVSPDETGWKIGRVLHWLWVAATPTTTVYRIAAGRGFDDAAALLGADFAGVLVRDGWAPYRRFTRATHQTCLAHLLRRCRLLHLDHPRCALPPQIQALLQQALALRDRRAAGTVSAHGFAVARGRVLAQLLAVLTTTRSSVPDVRRFAAHGSPRAPDVSRRPGHRRDQLARRARDPPGGRHAQGLRRQPHQARRRHTADLGVRAAHARSTRPRSRRRLHAAAAGASAPRRARATGAVDVD